MKKKGLFVSILFILLAVSSGADDERGKRIFLGTNPDGNEIRTYTALIIGIDDYKDSHVRDLKTAVNDATALAELLKKRYGFNVQLLLNGDATRKAIFNALRELAATSKSGESVLIYYAGHGEYDPLYKDGWWIPFDAESGNPLTYVDNVQVQKAVRNMKARHVLLISDSCYSGTLFGEVRAMPRLITDRYYSSLYDEKSRWGMTSGNKEPVSDAGAEGHSVFAYELLKALKKNQQPYLSTQEIYTRIAPIVSNNSEQTPLCRPIRNTGDCGGEFVFVATDVEASSQTEAMTSRTLPSPLVVQAEGRTLSKPVQHYFTGILPGIIGLLLLGFGTAVHFMKKKPGQSNHKEMLSPEKVEGNRLKEKTFTKLEHYRKVAAWPLIGCGIILLGISVVLIYGTYSEHETQASQAEALQYYNQGHYEKALSACDELKKNGIQSGTAHLISANIHLRNGNLVRAEKAYRDAIIAGENSDYIRVGALVGLGRIASIQKQEKDALRYYREASAADPNGATGYTSQAILMERAGEYDKASELFQKAQMRAPADQALAAKTNRADFKAALSKDQEKQKRIDQLVADLLETMDQRKKSLPHDGWTSRPLTLWIMDFESRGYSLQEGETDLLVSGIAATLLQKSRARLVERAVLDKVLEELKLGTSKLVDPVASLSLGRLLAARVILSGRIVYAGSKTQILLRLLETETGSVIAAVNKTFESTASVSEMGEAVSQDLVELVQKRFPLRGKISSGETGRIVLNIGRKVGVKPNEHFKISNENVILEVTDSGSDTSFLRIINGKSVDAAGQRVEACFIPTHEKEDS